MASDSDVEAYLNQLSRKTYSLKQDVQSWGSASSHPSRAEDKSDDDLHLSNESGSPVRTENQSSLKQKKEVAGSISHIGSYSKKHSGFGIKKTFTHDRFSSLEQKYLKKPSPSKNATGSKILEGHKQNHGNAFHQQRAEEMKYDGQAKASKSTIKQKTEYSNNANSRSKALIISDESSVDEELARYLNETSLTSNQGDEFHVDAKKSTAHSFNEDSDDSMDEVLNLENILTVEDILDQITGNESQAHGDSKYESICPGSSKNSSLTEKPETIIRDSDPPIHDSANPLIRNKSTSLKSNSVQVKALISDKSDISRDSMQAKLHGTDKKDKSMLFSSRKSLFYSNTKQDDSDHDKPVGILLAQSSTNVFHSLQRKSSIEFDTEGSVRPKASNYNSKNIHKMVESEVYSEGSVRESIASYTQRSIAESVEEGDLSTSAGMDKSVEENLAISVPESLSENIQALENTEKNISKTISGTEESMSSKARSQNTRKSSHNFLTVKSPSRHSSSRRKMLKPSHRSDTSEPWNISDHEESTKEKSKRKSQKAGKKRHKRQKSKKKYRTSTSESSSSESFSDSERDCYRRRHSQSHRYKWKYAFKPWSEPPYIQPWFHHYHQPYATPAGIFAHSLGPTVVEGFVGLGGVLSVKELMRQQVALTRQFLDSQQALYHAYTATLTSSYHYTSLSNTEKYIKKRKPPLTFSEAYKLVKEEMKATE